MAKTYFGLPTLNVFRSNEMCVGSSAPLQQVVMRAVDSVLLHLPTMMVTIGNACEIVRKQSIELVVEFPSIISMICRNDEAN